jgi:hypothetical protein
MSKSKVLLTTAAAAALVGAMTSSAMAFDDLQWNWTHTVNSDFDIFVDVDIDDLDAADLQANPAGIANVEAFQAAIVTPTADADLSAVNTGSGLVVTNTALAAGNAQNIGASDLAMITTGQFAGNPEDDGDGANLLVALAGIDAASTAEGWTNPYFLLGLAALTAEATGFIDPITVSATADLENVTANRTTNTASAMANTATWTVGGNQSVGDDTFDLGGGILVGDITQVAVATVAASATLTNVAGAGTTPEVANVAQAIGNNLNVRVGVGGTPITP